MGLVKRLTKLEMPRARRVQSAVSRSQRQGRACPFCCGHVTATVLSHSHQALGPRPLLGPSLLRGSERLFGLVPRPQSSFTRAHLNHAPSSHCIPPQLLQGTPCPCPALIAYVMSHRHTCTSVLCPLTAPLQLNFYISGFSPSASVQCISKHKQIIATSLLQTSDAASISSTRAAYPCKPSSSCSCRILFFSSPLCHPISPSISIFSSAFYQHYLFHSLLHSLLPHLSAFHNIHFHEIASILSFFTSLQRSLTIHP